MYHASHFTADLARSSSLGQIFYVFWVGVGMGAHQKQTESLPKATATA